jgi:DNA polymerase-3 subunit delta
VNGAKGYADFLRNLSDCEPALIYFFTGPEDFLKREALRKLAGRVLTAEARLLNYQSFVGADCGWGDVETACLSSPLFSEKRVVALAGVDVMGETDVSGLAGYARNACKSTCLVLMSSGQSEESRRRGTISIHRLISALQGLSSIYTFWQNDVRAWASEWLRENKKKMRDPLLREVLEASGRSGYEVWNVLEKGASLAGACEEITAEHVSLVGGAASVGSLNSFRLAVATADAESAHRHAAKCMEASVQPMILLWTLNRSFRDALRTSRGSVTERPSRGQRVPAETLGRRYSESGMCEAILLLCETERRIKTGLLDPRLAVELLINELTR